MTGLRGSLSIDSGSGKDEEALVTIGFSPGNHCPANNTQAASDQAWWSAMPDQVILQQFILKTNPGMSHSQADTTIDYGAGIPISGCIYVIMDGGAQTITMSSNMSLLYQSGQDVIPTVHFGTGYEYCFDSSSGCNYRTASGSGTFASVNKVPSDGTVLGLYGNFSDGLLAAPSGNNLSSTRTWYIDKGCSQFPTPGWFGPGDYASGIPSDENLLATVNVQGNATLQQSINQQLNAPVNAGDCIVQITQASVDRPTDSETQVMVLIATGDGSNLAAAPSSVSADAQAAADAAVAAHTAANATAAQGASDQQSAVQQAQAAAQAAADQAAASQAAADAAAQAQDADAAQAAAAQAAADQAAADQAAADAQAAIAAAVAARQTQVVYRYVNGAGFHLFSVVADGSGMPAGYTLEGPVFKVFSAQYASTTPLYRCQANGYQLLSTDAGCEGNNLKGVLGYIATSQINNSTPLSRSTLAGDYIESTNPDDFVSAGYTTQAVLGYVPN